MGAELSRPFLGSPKLGSESWDLPALSKSLPSFLFPLGEGGSIRPMSVKCMEKFSQLEGSSLVAGRRATGWGSGCMGGSELREPVWLMEALFPCPLQHGDPQGCCPVSSGVSLSPVLPGGGGWQLVTASILVNTNHALYSGPWWCDSISMVSKTCHLETSPS